MGIIESRKTISINGNDSISLDNHENATQKGGAVTVRSMADPTKKGCLKNGEQSGLSGLSLKKIVSG